jgi:DNA-binding NarL/FixJ family response regulator
VAALRFVLRLDGEERSGYSRVQGGEQTRMSRDRVPPDGLSEREVEVLRLIALGHTNAEIAEQLYLSVRTVETHRAHIQQKLRLDSRSELVRYAFEHQLIEAE